MSLTQENPRKKLGEVLDPSIMYLPRVAVLNLFGISRSTLTRDLTCLSGLRPNGFAHISNSKGFDRSTLEVMWRFRQLVKKFGYESAVERIKE